MGRLQYVLVRVVHLYHKLLVWVLHHLFAWMWDGERDKKPLPAIKSKLLTKSGVQLAKMIRNKQISSVELVKTFISRIEEINPILNCVTNKRYDAALAEAQRVDDLLNQETLDEKYSEENMPYLGVPFTTKEATAVEGMPHTALLLSLRHRRASRDADVIRLLRAAGGIPLAITNCSELCMWWESSNLIYGRTNNAYHPGRGVGGSSGGEGCLLSAAGSVIGVGSDIGGSLRLPAFHNGIFCIKPTTGVVSNDGQFPNADTPSRHECLCVGPMCRYAEDLLPMYKIMADENLHKLKLDTKVDLSDIRVYSIEGIAQDWCFLHSDVDPQIKAVQQKAANYLAGVCKSSETVQFREMRDTFPMWGAKMGRDGGATFCDQMGGDGPPINPFKELFKWFTGAKKHTLPGLSLAVLEKIKDSKADKHLEMLATLRNNMQEVLSDNGVFLYPTLPLPPQYHYQALTTPFNCSYTCLFNALGFPVCHVPMGLSPKEKVPIGIQVIANFYQDHIALAVTKALAEEFGGWVSPSVVEN